MKPSAVSSCTTGAAPAEPRAARSSGDSMSGSTGRRARGVGGLVVVLARRGAAWCTRAAALRRVVERREQPPRREELGGRHHLHVSQPRRSALGRRAVGRRRRVGAAVGAALVERPLPEPPSARMSSGLAASSSTYIQPCVRPTSSSRPNPLRRRRGASRAVSPFSLPASSAKNSQQPPDQCTGRPKERRRRAAPTR